MSKKYKKIKVVTNDLLGILIGLSPSNLDSPEIANPDDSDL